MISTPADPTDPNAPTWKGLRLAVRRRLAGAVAHLIATGKLGRADIQRIGEISVPQASLDLKMIRRRCRGLMTYDKTRKAYVLKTSKKPKGCAGNENGGPR